MHVDNHGSEVCSCLTWLVGALVSSFFIGVCPMRLPYAISSWYGFGKFACLSVSGVFLVGVLLLFDVSHQLYIFSSLFFLSVLFRQERCFPLTSVKTVST